MARGRVSLDAIGCRRADTGLGGSHRYGVGMSELHVEPHLMIVDVAARHPRHPLSRSYASKYLTGRNHQKRPRKGRHRHLLIRLRATPYAGSAGGDSHLD